MTSTILSRLCQGQIVLEGDLSLGPYQSAEDPQGVSWAALDRSGDILHQAPTPFGLYFWWRTGQSEDARLALLDQKREEQRELARVLAEFTVRRRASL